MGDFSNGIQQDNNMLSEMKEHNSEIAEHKRTFDNIQDKLIQGATEERQGVMTPEKLAAGASQLGLAAERLSTAGTTLTETYGGSKLAYAKNLGRGGQESSFGVKAIYNKLGGGSSDIPKAGPVQGPTTKPVFRPAGQYGETATGGLATTDGAGGLVPVQHFQLDSTATPDPKGIVSGGEAPIETPASKVVLAGADDAKGALRTAGGVAGDLVGVAGLGVGILSGGESLMADIMGKGVQGANADEKTGNKLSVLGAGLDVLGLAVPPLAILGGIAGLASSIFTGAGHIDNAKTVTDAANTAKQKPPETPMQVSSMASLGQVASRGTNTLHTISGTSAF